MNLKILKSCSVKLDGVTQHLEVDAVVFIPDEKAQRMIEAGYAELCQPLIEDCRALMLYIKECDPLGACWPWIMDNHADLWREHKYALGSENISEARRTFDEMVRLCHGRTERQATLEMVAS